MAGWQHRDTSRTDDALKRLMDRYAETGRPISVNFRRLVPWLPVGDRATHYLHPYPAKLLPHIPAFFLANEVLSLPGDTVLDPFCGSGTVLLESLLHGRHGIGADANPLARLITTAKVAIVTPRRLRSDLRSVLRCAQRIRSARVPPIHNLEFWFYPHVVEQLAKLRSATDGVESSAVQTFLRVCFSACVRRVSLADPRLSVPVRLRKDQYPRAHPFREMMNARLTRLRRQDVFSEFRKLTETNILRLEEFRALRDSGVDASVTSSDARSLRATARRHKPLPSDSISLIITSPPYAGAQKYIRASSLSLGWLELMERKTLRELEDENIGREHFPAEDVESRPSTGIADADARLAALAASNPLRAHIAAMYLLEMCEALKEAVRVLKPGGYLVLVASNNRICGHEFHTQRYLFVLLRQLGLEPRLQLVDAIRSRGLMTRRNTTASVISREWVQVFQKRTPNA
jgi:DNA modification methylase